ncbi:glucokinase [Sphingobacterium alimentarium]|uniref:Glucokinase n=1 Tax=Sphingobacterium alimentarium TaxID=797292 RepID=A0A4R3VSK0_9SPHI|nr:ROK family protein [Sphingobacterium alimentarium]TCV12566.1 glucokinase [Sphingobacterium alimentarium]
MNSLALCLDIGGTHITAAVVKAKDGTFSMFSHVREGVDSMADKDVILRHWEKGIDKVLSELVDPITEIYVSIPGPFDYENGISLMDGMHKYQSILYMDVKSYLSEKYAVPTDCIYFFNDAQAFLLGEVYHYGMYEQKVVGLTLGTGLGSAIFENGKVKDLNYGSAKFRQGIAEDYISTRGIIKYIKTHNHHTFQNVKELVLSDQWKEEKDKAFDFLADALVEFIQTYIIPLNPSCIILGGSIANAHDLFLQQVQSAVIIPLKIASMDEMNICYGMIANVKFNSINN